MGWFDDDDDEEEAERVKQEQKRKKQLQSFFDDDDDDNGKDTGGITKMNTNANDDERNNNRKESISGSNHTSKLFEDSSTELKARETKQQQKDTNGNDDDDEEVDPLDAFMNNLKNNSKKKSSSNDNNNKELLSSTNIYDKAERLDVENEDEATSHWEKSTTTDHKEKNIDDQDEDADLILSREYSKQQASFEMQTMFHKASSSSSSYNQHHHGNTPSSSSSSSRQINIQLEKAHHNNNGDDDDDDDKFEKCFWYGNDDTNDGDNNNTSQGHAWRMKHDITCHPNPIDPIFDFNQLKDVIPDHILQWNTNNNIRQPTLVQAQTLSVALSGRNAIVTASTGSGKTLSYVWPLLTQLVENNTIEPKQQQNGMTTTTKKCRGLILVPTRELALQVEKVVKSIVEFKPTTNSTSSSSTTSGVGRIQVLAITGGNLGRYQLSQNLLQRKPHVLIATPGRLLDVLSTMQKQLKNKQKSKQRQHNNGNNSNNNNTTPATTTNSNSKIIVDNWLLSTISFLVIDEADKMLQMGFIQQVTQIIHALSRKYRQTILTSATWPNKLQQLIYKEGWMVPPSTSTLNTDTNSLTTRIAIGKTGQSTSHVSQHVMCLPNEIAKITWLEEMLPILCCPPSTSISTTSAGTDDNENNDTEINFIGKTIVFCSTRHSCQTLAQTLQSKWDKLQQQEQRQHQNWNNYNTTTGTSSSSSYPRIQTLHGDMHPMDRQAAIKAFAKVSMTAAASATMRTTTTTSTSTSSPPCNLLIATDVAGRGLDIPQVATVINFEPAKNWDTHVHRIGRAGRMSSSTSSSTKSKSQQQQQQKGTAYTLLTPSNKSFAKIMISSLEREGKTSVIDAPLRQLAYGQGNNNRGKKGHGSHGGSGGTSSSSSSPSSFRSRHNKAGLGYGTSSTMMTVPTTSAAAAAATTTTSGSNLQNYYGPMSATNQQTQQQREQQQHQFQYNNQYQAQQEQQQQYHPYQNYQNNTNTNNFNPNDRSNYHNNNNDNNNNYYSNNNNSSSSRSNNMDNTTTSSPYQPQPPRKRSRWG